MVPIKTAAEIEKMRAAGEIAANALHTAGRAIKPGVTTFELDMIIKKYIESHGAKASFYKYNGFPGYSCISVGSKVIHGIPSKKEHINEGDIVSIDVGAYKDGFHGDTAFTFPCGRVSKEAEKLLEETNKALYLGIEQAVPGNRLGDISNAVQTHCEGCGYGVVREYIGHGVGRNLHESPEVPNFGSPGRGLRLTNGMTIAIEPMINLKGAAIRNLSDHWTVVTASGSISAHFEHTVAITTEGPLILTKPTI
jgi:methionyl aminopeptidase